jgi:hypothetical protein
MDGIWMSPKFFQGLAYLDDATADRSERVCQLDLRLQRCDPLLGFPCRQVFLEQFRLIRLGAERAQRRQLAGRHRELSKNLCFGGYLKFRSQHILLGEWSLLHGVTIIATP